MKLENFKCVDQDVNLDDYYKLYDYVIDYMEHPEWLKYEPIENTKKILKIGGKIWLYYDENDLVCSMVYLSSNNATLLKRNIKEDESLVGSLGPIMVSKDYIGNGLMNQMLTVFENYNKSIGKKYVFTKAVKSNI